MAELPLEGALVIELGSFYAAPAACAYLADLGARVVKIEGVADGDPMRYGQRWAGGPVPTTEGMSVIFSDCNRGKQSVALDIRVEPGRAALKRLLAQADVFVTNMRQGTLRRYGLWYDDVRDLNEGLIYAHISGFGPEGPHRDERAFDMSAQARSGLMNVLGHGGDPFTFHLAVDQLTANSTAWAVTAALLTRARTGKGTLVSASLLGSALDFLRIPLTTSWAGERNIVLPSRAEATMPTLTSYRCSDERWIALSVGIASDKFWPMLCAVIGRPELGSDERYDDSQKRAEHRHEVIEILDRAFARRTAEEWLADLRAAGFPAAIVAEPLAVRDDVQARANFIVPAEGGYETVAPPMLFGGEPAGSARRAPEHGADTVAVLTGIGGLTADDLRSLEQAAAIPAAVQESQ